MVELTLAQFVAQYPLQPNPCENAEPIWEDDAGAGCFFETYGPQLELVLAADPLCIWTILDDDAVISGYHVANRAGYLISTVPRPPGLDVTVLAPEMEPP